MICETPDIIFPMTAEVFYPTVNQGAYGNVDKEWVLDKIIVGNFVKDKSGLEPDPLIKKEQVLECRIKSDIRISTNSNDRAITNIVVSNIKDRSGNEIYIERSGPRKGESTLFEVVTQDPHIGPFGGIEYYDLILRRSENQGTDV
jgi:hypothetical protein